LARNNPETEKERHRYCSALRKIQATKEKQKRLKLIKTMTSIKSSWASEVLLDSLEEKNERIRELIIQELGGRAGLNLELVCGKLSHPLWYVKSSALKILGLQKNPSVLIHIEGMLAEPNVDVRRAAAFALGSIGGNESLAILLKLAKDENRFVRSSVEEAIRHLSKLRIT